MDVATTETQPDPWGAVPAELKALDQWVVWRWGKRGGKPTKVPFQARRPSVMAASTEPGTWGSFADAAAATSRQGVQGLGFVFSPSDPYCGLDFDGCLGRDGEVSDFADAALKALGGYQEVSPSGRGVKCIVRAGVERGHKGPRLEVYSKARFFCITGNAMEPGPIEDRQAVVNRLVRAEFPEAAPRKTRGKAATIPLLGDDETLLDKARRAANGPKFIALFDRGDVSGYPPSQGREGRSSEADLALASMLAFWCGPDPDRIDRLFRQSALADSKWDEKRGEFTYGELTIDRAMSREEFYEGPGPEARIGQAKGKERPAAGTPIVVRATEVEEKVVEWMWPDRVPLGFLTLFAGRTGIGKSFIALDLAARVTTGSTVPLTERPIAAGNVLIISEDSHEYVLKPRLRELGADMTRVFFMTWDAMGTYQLNDVEMLGEAYSQAGEPTLIIIDPPTNFLGARDEHKNSDVRTILMAVAAWTMQRSLACIFITHCNKGINKSAAALDRIIGSVAWATTSRVAHLLAPDPNQAGQCLFVPIKNNLGDMARGLSYRIEKTMRLARVVWLGESDLTSDEALNSEVKPRARNASAWIVDFFRDRRAKGLPLEVPSRVIEAAASECGIGRKALFEARQGLHMPPIRKVVDHDNGINESRWVVPPDWPPLRD